ncbi:MAG: GNAT family N-acetyltransferase [Longimicrobiales bacterium]
MARSTSDAPDSKEQRLNRIRIRAARPNDADVLLELVDALADYEKFERPSVNARERLTRDLFGPHPRIQAYLAELNGEAVAYAITLETYSSFLALPALYLEDIFVKLDYRRHGVGRALFRFLAGEAIRRGCSRMEWAVLDWNKLAIDFYEHIGARRVAEWNLYRLSAQQLQELSTPLPE